MTTQPALYAQFQRDPGEAGRIPVVLLHAFPVGPAMWQDLSALLPGDVLVAHLPGFGQTPTPTDAEPSLDYVAHRVAATLDEHEIERAVLVGLSMGGYVALAFCELFAERVAALGLLDTRTTADTEEARTGRLSAAQTVLQQRAVTVDLPAMLSQKTRDSRPHIVTAVNQWAAEADPAGVAWAQRAMAARPDRTEVARALTVPMLALAGAEDPSTPLETLLEQLGELPQLESVEVPDASHLSAVEQPEIVAEAINRLVIRAAG